MIVYFIKAGFYKCIFYIIFKFNQNNHCKTTQTNYLDEALYKNYIVITNKSHIIVVFTFDVDSSITGFSCTTSLMLK